MILRYFEYEHLPPRLREASQPFFELAVDIWHSTVYDQDEKEAALRKLLEAKDCFVRAHLEPPLPIRK